MARQATLCVRTYPRAKASARLGVLGGHQHSRTRPASPASHRTHLRPASARADGLGLGEGRRPRFLVQARAGGVSRAHAPLTAVVPAR
jgi:hypothetical protein